MEVHQMKSRIRTVVLGGLVLLVLSGIASASASAAVCKKEAGSKKFGLCIGGESIGTATETKSVPITTTTASGTLDGLASTVDISCATVTTENAKIESGGGKSAKIRAEFSFSNCKFTEESVNSKCQVDLLRLPDEGPALEGTFASTAELFKMKPGTERFLGYLETSPRPGGSCTNLGSRHLSGEIECTLSSSNETKQSPEVESVKKYTGCKQIQILDPPYNNSLTLSIGQISIGLAEPYKGKAFSIIEGK
jgi:hypothetical protein